MSGIVILGAITALTIEPVDVDLSADLTMYKEHTKGARKSTAEKHQKGQSRKQKDSHNEKGDVRRIYRGNKRKIVMIIMWFMGEELYSDNSEIIDYYLDYFFDDNL